MEKLRLGLLEKITEKKLLDEGLEEQRLASKVIKYPTKGYPEGYFPFSSKNDGRSAEFLRSNYKPSELIGEFKNDESENPLGLYRKAFPHCQYGAMVVNMNNKTEVSFSDLKPEDRLNFLRVAHGFADFCGQQSLFPNICWTYDPTTRDRKSGQSQMWYHMHLNSYSQDDKDSIIKESIPLREIDSSESTRSYIEEFSILASLIFSDYLKNKCEKIDQKITLTEPFESNSLPNIGFEIKEDWDFLLSKEFDNFINFLHKNYLECFASIRECLLEGEAGEWQRPQKTSDTAKLDTLSWLSKENLDRLKKFFDGLNQDFYDDNLDRIRQNPKSELTSHTYPVAGACYALNITKNERGNIQVSFRPQLFSDIGAAGLNHIFDVTVKLSRGTNTYTDTEIKDKEKFEEGLLDSLITKK